MTQSDIKRPPQQIMLDQLNGMWLSYAVQAAAYYNLATLVGDGSKTTKELAQQTGTHDGWIYRLLRYLAANGVFAETEPRTFVNTDLSSSLRSDRDGSMYAMARMMGSDRLRRTWGLLESSIKTGVPAVEQLFGMKLYEYFQGHAEEEAIFDGAMKSFSTVVNRAIAMSYDFSRFQRVMDVGGGNGSLILTIQAQHPGIQGLLFERPTVVKRIQDEAKGPLPFEVIAGDFFEGIPEGADVYLMKEVLHNWADDQCRTILQNCRNVMSPSSRIVLGEQLIIPENNKGAFAKGLDLLMGLEQQGRERTREEFSSLMESAGLRLTNVIPTRSPQWILEGIAV
jgi:hypothetical protein